MLVLKLINKKTILLLFTISFILNFKNFPGNNFLFLVYSLFSYFLFLTIIRKNINYFEFFFFSLLLLGFWLKPNTIFFFDYFNFTEGDFKFKEPYISGYGDSNIEVIYKVYNDTFYVITATFGACIIGSFLREYIQNKIYYKKEYKIKLQFVTFYKRYRYIILFVYIVGLSFLWLININFQIYSKGLINTQIPSLVRIFFAWCFNYGLSAMTAIYIYIDMSIYKQKQIIILGFIEAFFTNLSILSRAFLLVALAYIKGFIDSAKKFNMNIKFSNYLLLNLTFIIFFFIIGFFFVENLRGKKFVFSTNNNRLPNYSYTYNDINNSILKISKLATTRWVGIDSLLSVSSSDNKSFDLFLSSLLEEKKHKKPSFYMEHFFKSFKFEENLNANLNTVILPGLIAFLYYSGSYVFVIIGIIFFILLFSSIELIFLKFSNTNNLLGSIIGFTLAWRLAHFGYLPINTLQFLFSFFLTFIIVFLIFKFVWKR